MKKIFLLSVLVTLIACKEESRQEETEESIVEMPVFDAPKVRLSAEEANKLVNLPLNCISQEYPNKLGQTLESADEIAEPRELHPAFYGCFDWHSSVHAHWSLVNLLRNFPDLKKEESIRAALEESLSKENINAEVLYFNRRSSSSYERTYGWAWLLKLAEELHKWDDPLARELERNLEPLTKLIVNKFSDFLPKLNYPVRAGEHENTAFALVFAYDFAETFKKEDLKSLVKNRATSFYLKDKKCPYEWEPSGYDFLSPCFEEIDIMRRVMPETAFDMWMNDFFPQLKKENFDISVAEVSDRKDGKLVHLDGLNFSRAWVMFGLAKQYPNKYKHLQNVANKHVAHSLPHVVNDSYEGSHWLGSFAIYALNQAEKAD